MMGLTNPLSNVIQQLRVDELNSAKGFRWLLILTNMIGTLFEVVEADIKGCTNADYSRPALRKFLHQS